MKHLLRRFAMMTMMTMALVTAAAPTPVDATHLYKELRGLSVVGSVLYVAAHPDDENTRLLATFANEYQLRTAYLSFTRGEGGQNLIGPEIGPLLGVIRTQELLAARRTDGAEQYFTRARDFGYSKSVDETLSIWDHDRVLADAVWVIRSLRPDVIITRFSLDGGDTHGHHTASARLALEAFRAAADPAFHPEQLAQVKPWQAKRIVWNAWSRDGNKPPAGSVSLDSSSYDPVLGLSFGELAAQSRSMHKSQGFGAAPVHGPSLEYFVPLDGERATKDLLEGIDLSWKRVAGGEKVAALFTRAANEFRLADPAASVPTLLAALEELRKLPDSPVRTEKLEALNRLIVACLGLFVEATAATSSTVPGGTFDIEAVALNRSSAKVLLEGVTLAGGKALDGGALERGKALTRKVTLTIDAGARLTTPYWLEAPPTKGAWSIDERYPIGLAESAPALSADFHLTLDGHAFSVTRPVTFKWVDPTVGERHRPLEVLPVVSVRPSSELLVFAPGGGAQKVAVTVTANADAQEGVIALESPERDFVVEPSTARFSLAKLGNEAVLTFSVKPTSAVVAQAATSATLKFVATVGSTRVSQRVTRVEYAHIPIQTVLANAEVKVVRVDLRRGKTNKVGYIAGAGDEVPQALRQVGYEVTMLSDEALRSELLSRYDAIVVGIRAYNTNSKMPAYYPRLMQYVKDGGTLVAQYNTRNWLSNVPAEMGPYPFEIAQDRVTNEEAVVTFALPKHRVLNAPNAITERDFNGWVQERGLYFGTKWDSRYERPLSMHDDGEAPLEGSLLLVKHGKGTFAYTGLAFFRQLPAGVPGAYRLFANLLDHGS